MFYGTGLDDAQLEVLAQNGNFLISTDSTERPAFVIKDDVQRLKGSGKRKISFSLFNERL